MNAKYSVLVAGLALAVAGGCPISPNVSTSGIGNETVEVAEDDAIADAVEFVPGQATLDGEDRRFALLIGTSKYDHFGEDAELQGPQNDIALMKTLLVGHFGMNDRNVQTLSEGTNDECRPTKGNIAREVKRITEQLRPDDYVVFYFSGHGCQQPDFDEDAKVDPEPDGLDEVLLPADSEYVEQDGVVELANAITDDELRSWLNEMRDRGASTWVVIDACHSGTVTRGRQRVREIRPESIFPAEVLQQARERAAARGLGAHVARVIDADEKSGGIVAVYAAQPHEPTFELPLPDEKHGEWRGLLTYTLAKVLLESPQPLTYAELLQRIQAEYVVSGHFGPTPLVEGSDRDRQILGDRTWPQRATLALSRDRGGTYSVNGGKLHGLNTGSVLAIHPPVGNVREVSPVGYVEVESATALSAKVNPVEYDGQPAIEELPVGGNCEPVSLSFGDGRIKVAVAEGSAPSLGAVAWKTALQNMSGEDHALVEFVESSDEADWIVESTKLGQGVLISGKASAESPRFGPIPPNAESADWFAENLARIARAQNLMRIAGMAPSERQRGWLGSLMGASKMKIKPQLVRLADADDSEGEPLKWQAEGVKLHEGEIIALDLTNTGSVQVDVTVLFIDSRFGIEPIFPNPDTVADNRLPPGESLRVGPMQVQGNSIGFEHLLVIATNGQGQPLDFSWLAQDSLEQARSLGATPLQASQATPLGQLLQQSLFNPSAQRGLKMAATADVVFRSISWQTVGDDEVLASDSPESSAAP